MSMKHQACDLILMGCTTITLLTIQLTFPVRLVLRVLYHFDFTVEWDRSTEPSSQLVQVILCLEDDTADVWAYETTLRSAAKHLSSHQTQLFVLNL